MTGLIIFVSAIAALWRWTVTIRVRSLLSRRVAEIARAAHLDPDDVAAALDDHRRHLLTLREGDHDRAAQLYYGILTSYPIQVVELTRCATLLRHGLVRGQLTATDYDLAQALCQKINGGHTLAPLLRKIDRTETLQYMNFYHDIFSEMR